MSNNKQSSVRWIVEELEKFELGTSEFYSKTAIINRGERMHKEEIKNAFTNGFISHLGSNRIADENFYNETYGDNK